MFGHQIVDISQGLGKQVTVMGISGSGTLAAWLAQNRVDVGPLVGLWYPAVTIMMNR